MRVVLITGGNKGLGYETAKELKDKGYKVYIGSRSEDRGKKAANELGVNSVQIDVTDVETLRNAAHEIREAEGRLDILINNAGISGDVKKVDEVTGADVERVYDTNVFGVVRTIHMFVPLLEQSEQPVIVNVSSGLGSFGMVTDPDTQESKVNSLAY